MALTNSAAWTGGRKEPNFISSGFLTFFNLVTIVVVSRGFSLVPAAQGVLGGLSLAILVMMLTLRSLRRVNNEQTPAGLIGNRR